MLLTLLNQKGTYLLRLYSLPRFRLAKTRGSFMRKGIAFINKVPQQVIDHTLLEFKNHVKKTLMGKGYYKVDYYLKDQNVWK